MMTLNEMIRDYEDRAFTHDYIFGFNFKGKVYMNYATSDLLEDLLTLDRTSKNRGAKQSLRFKPNITQKMILLERAEVICTLDEFEAEVKTSIYNRGEIFEKKVTEYFGQTWVKDNVSFEEAGDVEVYGMAIQIKYEKATFMIEGRK